jgi:hypothetical protein
MNARTMSGRLLALLWGLSGANAFGGTVSGTVIDHPSLRPLAGAWAYLANGSPAMDSVRTDSAGEFRFSGVEGCDPGCTVRVRMPDYWPYESESFALAPDQDRRLEIRMEMIHALTVRIVKGEDTAQALAPSQAVLFSMGGDGVRCEAADSAGIARFADLESFTGYLLTVSAPGRKATSLTLHFHGPPAQQHMRVALDLDSAGGAKKAYGTLSAKDGKDFPGGRVLLSCRNERMAADLFAQAGTDGNYVIEGVPVECDSAWLRAGGDSLFVALPESENRFDWAVAVPRPDAVARRLPVRSSPRADRKRAYDLIGRKLSAGRARSRP